MYVNVMLGNKKGMENETYLFYRVNFVHINCITCCIPKCFSFEDVETVHIGIFIFILFVVDCCISIWLSKRKHVQDKKEMERKRENVHFG